MNDIVSHLGVTSETVRAWIKCRELPAKKIGGRWKFRLSEVDEWAETVGEKRSRRPKTIDAKVVAPTLIKGDCVESLKTMKDSSIDLIVTDPPYNLGLFMQERDTNLKRMRENYFGAAGWDDLEYDEWSRSIDRFFSEANRVMKQGASMVVFMAVIKVETVIKHAQRHGFYYKTTGTWHKLNPMPRNMNLHFINSTESWIYFINNARTGTYNNGGKALHDFIEMPVASKGERSFGKHPTQKPVALMSHFVETLSNPGDTVLDPFMGSGSTGVAALKAGRRFVGVELDERYFEMAKRRMRGEEK